VELTVYAEANQFILFGGAESSADEDGEVSNAELAAHVAARLSTLVVFTASYGVVSVCFESSPPSRQRRSPATTTSSRLRWTAPRANC
jgi:hypothetical protein